MLALNRKVLRDLWHLRGQVLAIGLVIASGVAVLVMSLSTLVAMQQTAEAYYDRYRLADVFAGLKRAPQRVAVRIEAIPGVQAVETRVVSYATIDIEGFSEPVLGQFVSLPDRSDPMLNKLVLRAGNWLQANRPDQIILNEPFAKAHKLGPGDTLVAILNGKRRTLTVVGIALSPEFIYSLGPGALMADDKRFGIVWMGRSSLAATFDLKSAFNNISLELSRGTAPKPVIQQLDDILQRYGGVGAIARADQQSNWFVMNEIDQMATISKILPTIFLIIAAFLTNMVLARLIATERSQIGLMKAFGYSNWEVGLHYAKIVIGIALVGIVIGAILGAWLGRVNTQMYANLFRFPILIYEVSVSAFVIAGAASLLAALAGSIVALQRVVRLPPAQAMQPPSPPAFRRNWLQNSRLGRWFDQPTRIIMRNIMRWPGRAALTGLGIAASVSLLVLAFQWQDSLDHLAQSYFFDAQRQHMMVGFSDPQGKRTVHDLRHLPGVLSVEPVRVVGADFTAGRATHRGGLTGSITAPTLQPIYDDARESVVAVPSDGLVLGAHLAEKLNVGIGDTVWVRLLEGRRPERPLVVTELFESYIAMPAYVHIDTLNRMLREPPSIIYASLLVDRKHEAILYRKLKDLPKVSAVMIRQAAIDSFYNTIIEHLMVFITMFSTLACIMGFGVAYNSARITLSERGRELATLRVLGFSRGEISYILLGEVAFIISVALPLGCMLGFTLSKLVAAAFDTELFRIPLIIDASTYGFSVLIALAATALSAVIVRRRVDRLNLIEVLKTRE